MVERGAPTLGIAPPRPAGGQQVGDGEDEEEVVRVGFPQSAVEQGVDRALKTATRAAPSRQQTKGTLRHERITNGVEPVKSDPDKEEHTCDEESPISIEKRRPFHFLPSNCPPSRRLGSGCYNDYEENVENAKHERHACADKTPLASILRGLQSGFVVAHIIISLHLVGLEDGHNSQGEAAEHRAEDGPYEVGFGARAVHVARIAIGLLEATRPTWHIAPRRHTEEGCQFGHLLSHSPVGHTFAPHVGIACHSAASELGSINRTLLLLVCVKIKITLHFFCFYMDYQFKHPAHLCGIAAVFFAVSWSSHRLRIHKTTQNFNTAPLIDCFFTNNV